MDEVSRVLRERRLSMGLSVAETARRAGITRAYLYRIEDPSAAANPSVDVLERLAFVLGLDGAQDLGFEPRGPSLGDRTLPSGFADFLASTSLPRRHAAALQALIPYASPNARSIDWELAHAILTRSLLR